MRDRRRSRRERDRPEPHTRARRGRCALDRATRVSVPDTGSSAGPAPISSNRDAVPAAPARARGAPGSSCVSELFEIARDTKDYQSEQFVEWFLEEQLAEESTMQDSSPSPSGRARSHAAGGVRRARAQRHLTGEKRKRDPARLAGRLDAGPLPKNTPEEAGCFQRCPFYQGVPPPDRPCTKRTGWGRISLAEGPTPHCRSPLDVSSGLRARSACAQLSSRSGTAGQRASASCRSTAPRMPDLEARCGSASTSTGRRGCSRGGRCR